MSQVNALGPERGGRAKHNSQNAYSDVLLHGDSLRLVCVDRMVHGRRHDVCGGLDAAAGSAGY